MEQYSTQYPCSFSGDLTGSLVADLDCRHLWYSGHVSYTINKICAEFQTRRQCLCNQPRLKRHKEFNTCECTINQVLMSLLALFIYRFPKALSALTSFLVRRTEKIIGHCGLIYIKVYYITENKVCGMILVLLIEFKRFKDENSLSFLYIV